MDALWLTLALRAGVTAAIVITAAILAERAGPRWGGLVATLPVSAGPAFVMLAMQHAPGFIAEAALGSMAANPATVFFGTIFVRLVVPYGLAVALPAGLLTWLVSILVIRSLGLGTEGVVALNVAAHAAGILFTRKQMAFAVGGPRVQGRAWYDLPMRAVLVGLLVVTASHALGPFLSGIGAVIPITYTSLLMVVTPRQGREAAAAVMASALRGFAGFSLGFLALHLLAVPMGSAGAMLVALAVMLAWSGGVLLVRRR